MYFRGAPGLFSYEINVISVRSSCMLYADVLQTTSISQVCPEAPAWLHDCN